jgi:hypothetical protein
MIPKKGNIKENLIKLEEPHSMHVGACTTVTGRGAGIYPKSRIPVPPQGYVCRPTGDIDQRDNRAPTQWVSPRFLISKNRLEATMGRTREAKLPHLLSAARGCPQSILRDIARSDLELT